MSGRILRCGERALLVELNDLHAVLALNGVVIELKDAGAAPWDVVLDVVPAASTLFVTVAIKAAVAPLRQELESLIVATHLRDGLGVRDTLSRRDRVVEIPVHYDGPDLDEVGELTGLGASGVVVAHTGTAWRVAFGGFAPGFAYLVDGDRRLEVPRRRSPRTAVPAGAVALAGTFSGVYPRQSPGGWQLIGHTTVQLWDTERTPPALLQPGWAVHFADADG